jgi:hypothetical protein
MRGGWTGRLLVSASALGIAIGGAVPTHGQNSPAWLGVLDEHPAIQYAARPTSDRIARLNQTLAQGGSSLRRDERTGYLRSVLEALGVPVDSQLLVFSKTGVQRAYTSPHNPRALYFDPSVAVAYVPGAPLLEIAAHDPQQGVVFYTLDQTAASPVFTRQRSCLSCHRAVSTLEVPGMIARSHIVGDDGNILPQTDTHAVTHQTRHPDRWGGWFVTSEDAAPPYQQLAHLGNVTFSGKGNTSNQVFVDWMTSEPESRGYLLSSSDIAGLLVFDHQMHAINLLTRLNWESRVAASSGRAIEQDATVHRLANELADYLVFTGEAPPLSELTPRPGFAASLAARVPKDHLGRSLGQLDLVDRLLRYPCSFMVYSEAFEGLPAPIKTVIYHRITELLSATDPHPMRIDRAGEARRVALEILKETKPDFPLH